MTALTTAGLEEHAPLCHINRCEFRPYCIECDCGTTQRNIDRTPEDGPYRSELKAWARAVGRDESEIG